MDDKFCVSVYNYINELQGRDDRKWKQENY